MNLISDIHICNKICLISENLYGEEITITGCVTNVLVNHKPYCREEDVPGKFGREILSTILCFSAYYHSPWDLSQETVKMLIYF